MVDLKKIKFICLILIEKASTLHNFINFLTLTLKFFHFLRGTEGQPPWLGLPENRFKNLASKILDSKFGQQY